MALKTGDKMPVVNGWPDRARRDPLADVEDVPTSNALNTGLLADGLRIIDLGVDDADTAHRLRALAGSILDDTPCIRTRSNSSRVAILYRAAEGAPKKISEKGKLGGVEVLGRGNQLHAYGPHPSDAALIWETPPHETPIDRLPAVTEAQIATFLAAAALLIGAEPEPEQRKAPAAGQHQSSARGASADPLDVTAALAEVPNDVSTTREYWNRVGMATYAATGGSEAGLAAWCEWSKRHPTHNPDAMRKKWEDYKTSPPTRIGAGLLFHMATEARPGWKKPSDTMQHKPADQLDPELLANPDMSVLRLGRRAPPELPLDVFGPDWSHWLTRAAEAAAAPVDYVALPLLAVVSALIGARWAQATDGWCEPPHIWAGAVGDSGSSKSLGSDCLLRDRPPVIEQRMMGDFPDRLRDWKAAAEAQAAANESWKVEGESRPSETRSPGSPRPRGWNCWASRSKPRPARVPMRWTAGRYWLARWHRPARRRPRWWWRSWTG